MFWKLFKLQELLNSLFDDGWLRLSLSQENVRPEPHDANRQAPQV
jgi:hypothetical protein